MFFKIISHKLQNCQDFSSSQRKGAAYRFCAEMKNYITFLTVLISCAIVVHSDKKRKCNNQIFEVIGKLANIPLKLSGCPCRPQGNGPIDRCFLSRKACRNSLRTNSCKPSLVTYSYSCTNGTVTCNPGTSCQKQTCGCDKATLKCLKLNLGTQNMTNVALQLITWLKTCFL
uniref:Basic phospholipase A2-like n=1 Tax=Geotrypetes seraphini TaxID=260995 RepID=A0A6P8PU67_GEOSA|nr:basic phospholipase A2-like [Geotrypetes seraphini]